MMCWLVRVFEAVEAVKEGRWLWGRWSGMVFEVLMWGGWILVEAVADCWG